MAVVVEGARHPGLFDRVGHAVHGFLRGDDAQSSLNQLVELPWNIRYQLSVSGQLGPTEIRMLADNHIDAAFYLTTKGLEEQPEEQIELDHRCNK